MPIKKRAMISISAQCLKSLLCNIFIVLSPAYKLFSNIDRYSYMYREKNGI